MVDKLRKKVVIEILIGIIITMGISFCSMYSYATKQYERVENQTARSISLYTQDASNAIYSSAEFSLSSIQVISTSISSGMKSDHLTSPQSVISDYIDKSPFTNIEYIDKEGMNYTTAGDVFDASNRVYFIEGMKGNTGIWVNFAPRYSKEALLNFYTPLYYNKKIVGVLTGTLGGNTNMSPLLMNEYLNQPIIGALVDEDNRIIACTEEFELGTYYDVDASSIDNEYKDVFKKAIEKADGTPVYIGGEYYNSICIVYEIGNTGWKVIEVAPSTSIHGIISGTSTDANHVVALIFGSAILLFMFVLFENRRVAIQSISLANMERDKQLSVMLSISDMYYSMHIIDLVNNTVFQYSAKNQVYDEVQRGLSATVTMRNVMKSTMADDYLEQGLEFTDLTTIANRMVGKKVTYSELKGKHVGWIRLSFIALEVDENEKPTKVICTTEIIDEEKKREQALVNRSNTDGLTGFFNRRAYQEDVKYTSNSDDLVYISMDVNGLKVVNDTLGHAAGDELICGAAECMKFSFGSYGRLYRVGGDEFVALIEVNEEKLEELKKDFEYTTIHWKGALAKSLNISCGYVLKKEFPNLSIEEIANIADKRMYKAKADFYRLRGIDRRSQTAANEALTSLYTKILRINLTDDSFLIVTMDQQERFMNMGYSEHISEWFKNFGTLGFVHPDDIDNYFEKTDIHFLSQYFKQNKTSITIQYRRKIQDTYKLVEMEMIPADDYTDANQSLFLYVKEIDK